MPLGPPVPNFAYTAGDSLADWSSWPRAGNASYYDQTGVIQTLGPNIPRDNHWLSGVRHLLVENSRTNTLLYSQDFTNVVWTRFNGVATANATTAPDGTLTADAWVPAVGNLAGGVLQQGITMSAGKQQAFSFFIKKAAASWCYFQMSDLTGNPAAIRQWINIQTGAIGTNAGGAFRTLATWPLANGWLRVEAVMDDSHSGAGAPSVQIRPANADADTSFFGDGATISHYLWGAQFEKDQRSCTSYVPTMAAPATRAIEFEITRPHNSTPQSRTLYVDVTCIGVVTGSAWWLIGPNSGANHAGYAFGNHGSPDGVATEFENLGTFIPFVEKILFATPIGGRSDGRVASDGQMFAYAGLAINGGVESFAKSAQGVTGYGQTYTDVNYHLAPGFITNDATAIRRFADFLGVQTLAQCRQGFIQEPVNPAPPDVPMTYLDPVTHRAVAYKNFWRGPLKPVRGL